MVKRTIRVLLGWAIHLERLLGGLRLLADPDAVKSVLILEYRLPLGCLVHLTPLFEAIKADRPELVVTVATRGLGAELLRHNPCVDFVVVTPDALVDTIGAAKVLDAKLTKLGVRPDCVLTGASDTRSRMALLGMLIRRGWRGGFTLVPEMYQWSLEYAADKSLIDNNLRLAALVGCRMGHREPKVYFSIEDVATADGLVFEANADGRPLVVMVTQGSGGQRTGWSTERFVEVIRYASHVLGCCVVFVGTAGDTAAVEVLREGAGGIGVSVTGRTSVTELAALLAMSDAVVSLDTGTMHVGRAVGVPMVVLGPSWQKPLEWLPMGIPQVKILRGVDRESVPEGYKLDDVEAGDVTAALQALLEAYPASVETRAQRIGAGLCGADHLA
jgi:ADP-heptose:LPS heptosyltransferase